MKILALLVASALILPAQTIDSAAVDAVVRDALAASHTPGAAVAIVKDDRVIYLKGHGVRELGRSEPVTPDSLFCVGSLTKAFTSASIAMLVDEGKMSWDDPVRRHLDYFRLADPLADANVTIRDLLSHRTGLERHDLLWMDAPWNLGESIRRIGRVPLSYPFRAQFHYQNIMYNAAGYALAHAAGKPWQDFVRERIFEPLGMTGVKITSTEAQQAADHASPHLKGADGAVERTTWFEDDRQIRPAGSIKANARDLSHWMRFQLGDGAFEGRRLVSKKNLMETHQPQIVVAEREWPDQMFRSYGMAWYVSDYRGHMQLSHTGAVKGFHAFLMLLPNERLGIIVLTNLDASWAAQAAGQTIADIALGLPKRDWNAAAIAREQQAAHARQERAQRHVAERHPGTKPSRELSAYAGAFENPAYGTARVSAADGKLAIEWSRFHVALEHYHFDMFDVIGERLMPGEQVRFSLDPAGNVASMSFLGMEFKRAAGDR